MGSVAHCTVFGGERRVGSAKVLTEDTNGGGAELLIEVDSACGGSKSQSCDV